MHTQQKPVSEQELRKYFLETLEELIDSDNIETQIGTLENKLYEKSFGYQNGTPFDRHEFDLMGKVLIRKWIWALIVQGKLVPGNETDQKLPFLTITPEGKDWVKTEGGGENSFFTSSRQYMERLTDLGIDLGNTAKSYAEEAVHSYYNGCPKASMVMIGVAMESLMDELYDALKNTKNNEWKDLVPEKKPYNYSKIIDKINPIFDSKRSEIKDITEIEKPEIFLTPMLEHLRQLRNDGAHASLPNHDVNEAFAMLEIFMRTSTIICRLTAYLKES